MKETNIPQTFGSNRVVSSIPKLGPESVQLNCPHCHSNVRTTTEPNNMKGCLVGWFVCLFGLGIPCIWCCLPCVAAIPCFVTEFQDVAHTCPDCGALIGKYKVRL